MSPQLLQMIPGGPELLILLLMVLIVVGILFVLYKVVQAAVRSAK